jgi:lambda family phage portal protein
MLFLNANQPRFEQGAALPVSVRKVTAASHDAASSIPEFRRWNVTRGSADSDLLPEIGTIRDRQRDLERNNGIASGYFRTMKDNIVGTGPRLAMMPDYRMLGRDKDWAQEYCHVTEAAFRSFAESRECDVRGQLDLALQTRQVLHSVLLNGEALALPLWMPTDRSRRRWATQLQLLESDRLSNPDLGMDSEFVRGGIKVNQFGRPLGYYIQASHPGDRFYVYGANQYRWDYIPAETKWGRKRVLHCFDAERVDQKRGRPALTAVMKQFRMLDRYQSTEMQAAVINAVIAAFLETPLDGAAASELLGTNEGVTDNNQKWKAYSELQRDSMVALDGSTVMTLPPGTKMNAWSPNRPADAFGPFIEAVVRNIAAGVNLPYELLMKDFSKVNYSSARAALLEAWRLFATHRYWLKVFWLDEVLKLWLEEAVSYGDIVVQGKTLTLEEYWPHQYEYTKCSWIWPGRGWVDPVKEAQAAQIRMKTGLSTLQRECAEQGLDWEEVLEQKALEQERMRELGVTLGEQEPAERPAEKEEEDQ